MNSPRRTIVRWRALGPLALLLGAVGLLWWALSDTVARISLQEAGTQVLGTQVDLDWVRIREAQTTVELGGLAVADPFDPNRNLVEIEHLQLDLDPRALLERKLIIREVLLDGLGVGTARETPATPVQGGGILARSAAVMGPWRERLAQPFLGWSAPDSIRQIVLDRESLQTIQRARAVVGRADSLRQSFVSSVTALDPSGAIADGRALAERIAGADPAQLGIAGARQLVADATAFSQRVDDLEGALDRLAVDAQAGVTLLEGGLAEVDRARQEDYRRVEQAVGLPGLEGPAIGGALFGQVSLSYLERAVYWAEFVRTYMPPGLQPMARSGPPRTRASGTTVVFPQENRLPPFLLERGHLQEGATRGVERMSLSVSNLTSTPALVGQPATVEFRRAVADTVELEVAAVVDHTGPQPRDSLFLSGLSTTLPSASVPGMPLSVELGSGRHRLAASLTGDQLRASWTLEAPAIRWLVPAGTAELPLEQRLLVEALRGVTALQVSAELEGGADGLRSVRVRSNLDEVVARQVEAMAGDAVRLARRRARLEVDRLTTAVVDSAMAGASEARRVLDGTVPEWRTQLEAVRQEVQTQVRAKTGGLGGILGMFTPIDGSPSYLK